MGGVNEKMCKKGRTKKTKSELLYLGKVEVKQKQYLIKVELTQNH